MFWKPFGGISDIHDATGTIGGRCRFFITKAKRHGSTADRWCVVSVQTTSHWNRGGKMEIAPRAAHICSSKSFRPQSGRAFARRES